MVASVIVPDRAARMMPNAAFGPMEGLDHANACRQGDLGMFNVRRFRA